LNTTETYPTNIVFNEGIGGDESYDAAFTRIKSILDRHPDTDKVLIMLGTNDALATIPPGLSCSGAGCDGTFKGNLQTLVDKIRWADYPLNTVPSNITPVVALAPPAWNSSTPWTSGTNNAIRDYNTVVSSKINGIQVGPDFFSTFMPSATKNYSSLFYDTLHPNGLGYVVMANLWHNFLDPANPLALPFILDDLASSGTAAPKQNLIETGDTYYLDQTFTVASGGIPDILRWADYPTNTVPQKNARWIMSNDADRGDSSADYLSFSISIDPVTTTYRPVSVYVAYDSAASSLPTWMTDLGFAEVTGQTVSTTNAAAPTLQLYARNFTSADLVTLGGNITLGGNMQGGPTGASCNYVAIVVEN
jgi:lysophospholipase L1-like esterase